MLGISCGLWGNFKFDLIKNRTEPNQFYTKNQPIMEDEPQVKRRRIIIEDEEEDEVGSNPDELLANENSEEEEEGEDLGENWLE